MKLPSEQILKTFTIEQVKSLFKDSRNTIKKKYQLPTRHEVIDLNFSERSLRAKNKS